MINFHYELDFEIDNELDMAHRIEELISRENRKLGEINYILCSDEYLHQINVDFLGHDTYTDIISFDYALGKELHGDIYISIDRVRENALEFETDFTNELRRVMFHGVLHYCGYKDKTDSEKAVMRSKEDFYLKELL